MESTVWYKLLLLMLFHCHPVAGDFVSDEENLRRVLFGSYVAAVRPNRTTQISVSLLPLSLNKLDIEDQQMVFTGLVAMAWADHRLSWEPALHGGIDYITATIETIWAPSIVIENAVNNVGTIGGKRKDGTQARIMFNGFVLWYPPIDMVTSCEMKISKYPFDTQQCYIIFTGWASSEEEVNMTAQGTNLQYYSPNGEWDFLDSWTDVGYFTDGTQYFKRLYFYFSYRRKWQFYGQNLVLPIVLTSILMCAVFALPIESGEKMGFSLTVLLSYVVFLTWVTDNLPPTSTDVSVLQIYLAIVLCLGILATLLTTWVLHLYHTLPSVPLCPTMRTFVSRVLAPIRDRTCCGISRGITQNETNAETDAELNREPSNRINPVDADMPARLPPIGERDKQEVSSASESNAKASRDGHEEFTWPEVAAMADRFFLLTFSVTMTVITACIIGVLYSDY